jgi:hypothetical protein
MFIGNKDCYVFLPVGRNLYGEDLAPTMASSERCAVVELMQKAALTNQRSQMAGSMAHAEDLAITAKIKLEMKTIAVLGAKIVVDDMELRVVSITPKRTSYGQLDHFDVECAPWA